MNNIHCLILDDDIDFLELISVELENQGMGKITSFSSAQQALQFLSSGSQHNISIIITDFNMPDIDGLEFIQQCRHHCKNIPIILMTGTPEECNAKHTLEQNANEYIVKPFTPPQLIRKIMPLVEAFSGPEKGYSPIRSTTLFKNKEVPFNTFLLNYNQYRVLLKRGELLTDEHINLLKKYNKKKLYISASDEQYYWKYLEENLPMLLQNKNISDIEKGMITIDHSALALQHLLDKPEEVNLQKLQSIGKTIETVLEQAEKSSLYTLLRKQQETTIYQHAIQTASICLLLSHTLQKLRLKKDADKNMLRLFEGLLDPNSQSEQTLISAALLHEIGKMDELYDPQNPISHVELSMKALKNSQEISPKIIELVEQHEELCDGSGGPQQITKNKMSTLAQILSLAVHIEKLMSKEDITINEGFFRLYRQKEKFNAKILDLFKLTTL